MSKDSGYKESEIEITRRNTIGKLLLSLGELLSALMEGVRNPFEAFCGQE